MAILTVPVISVIVQLVSVAAGQPDWAASEGQPFCPDCSLIRCINEVTDQDCPEGTVLEQNKILGCCPACVKYKEYGSKCPLWTASSLNIHPNSPDTTPTQPEQFAVAYDGVVSQNLNFYPDNFIEQSIELPCSYVTLDSILTNSNGILYPIPERVSSISWVISNRNPEVSVPLIESHMCEPKLRCYPKLDDNIGLCDIPTVEDVYNGTSYCEDNMCACKKADYWIWDNKAGGKKCGIMYWEPQCHIQTGTYHLKQIKSKDRYWWCSSPEGSKLHGRDVYNYIVETSSMNCKCSRKHWELGKTKTFITSDKTVPLRTDISLHCDAKGNYEELQCDNKRCWCMDSDTGLAVSRVVPETLMTLLPCYYRNSGPSQMGGQYLRKCEARMIGMERTKQKLDARGTIWQRQGTVTCDPDGGFSKVLCGNDQCRCVSNTMQQIGSAQFPIETQDDLHCGCSRDNYLGLTKSTCDANGNYKELLKLDGVEMCIDPEDGWRVSGRVWAVGSSLIPDNIPCCLDTAITTSMGDFLWPFTSPVNTWQTFNCRERSVVNQGGLDTYTCHFNENNEFCKTTIKLCDPLQG